MFNNTMKEMQSNSGDRGKEIYPGELTIKVNDLINGFVRVIQPKMNRMSRLSLSDSFACRSALETTSARYAAIDAGNPLPAAVFKGVGKTFRVFDYSVDSPEGKALSISSDSTGKPSEFVTLFDDGILGNGSVGFAVKRSNSKTVETTETIDTAEAVKGAERMLRRLKRTIFL